MLRWIIIFIITLILVYCSIRPVHAAIYRPADDLIGTIHDYKVKDGDNLYDIARRFDIGIVELLAANPDVDVWTPEVGTTLRLTTEHVLPPVREGIVLNLSELRLFYFADDGSVISFPIGIGREGWETPRGETAIVKKRKNPVWIAPASIREENPDLPEMIPAGPDNPMGAYALNLGWPSYAIHGTNRPYGIGKRSSHGCIRLYPEDIKQLFEKVEQGTKVTVIDQAYKLGWRGNQLYLEITPTQQQSDAIAEYSQPTPLDIPEIHEAVRAAADDKIDIDWYAVDKVVAARNGIPTRIAEKR